MPTDTLLFRALALYGGYVAVSLVAAAAGSELLMFFWPHLAGLALQDFGGASEFGVFALQATGVVVVGAPAWLIQHRTNWPRGFAVAILLVPASLAAFTLLAFGLAVLLGWSYGV